VKKSTKKKAIDLSKHCNIEVTKEYEDGGAQLSIEYDNYFKDFIRRIYGRYTKKNVRKFIMDGITDAMKEKPKTKMEVKKNDKKV